MEKRYTISVHDINGKALGVLYDSDSYQSGSAYNIKITKEVSGWKEMSFVLPMHDDDGNENWRAQFIRNENKIYVKAEGEEEDVYLIKEPVGLHDSNKISVTVNASHISEELKTKNLYKYFDDENGIGKCSDLIEKAIGGTGWTLGECDTFYEADGTTEKIRSYSCDSKTGAYNMISGICELFYARPVFHGNRVVDIVSQKSTDGWLEANFGMNLTKIQKTYDSSNLVTRLYVEGEYGDFGYVGIDDVNPTGLPFILNFDYYKNLGVFTNTHQAALDAFVRDYKTYSDQISSKTTEMLKDQSTLNNLISSFGYAYYPVVNGAASAANRILGSDITDENAELKTGDSVAVVKTDYSYEYKEYPVASLTGVRAIIKFHPTITGSMGANEDMLEASVANVSTFLDEINDVLAEEGKPNTTVAGLKSTYGVANLETIKSGSFDLSVIPSPYNEDPILEYSYQIGKLETEQSTIRVRLKEYMKAVCESIVNIDSLKKQIAQAVENQAVAENTFATAMGSMLRDGYWSDDNYAPGQEQSLYADALEISKKLSFPIVSYSATIEDLSHAPLCKIEYDEDGKPEYVVDSTYHKELSFNLAQVVRIYDGDMPYNDYAVTTKVVECVDNPTSNSCELQSDLSDIGQKTFASILERVTEMAEKVRQNKDIYERAVAISKDGKIDTSTLEGTIDVLKTKLMSTVSNWKTDANGNIIFESLDGSSAMMLTGNGFMCAASKKEDGSWNWRTFGTGEGFTADMIVTGFLDADRIKANSITVKKLASDVGSGLDISSNESITSIVGDVTEANSKITQTKDKIEWLVSGDGTTQQFALTENGLKAIANDIDLSANNSITSYVGNKIGEVNETINQQASDFAGIVTGINKDIESLQDQVDGSITTWFYPTAPTNENEPAQKWTTIDEKNIHLGDLYYDTVTGYCYRWQVKDNAYSWQKITDTDVTKALEDAANAQGTANEKRRVFVVKPTPPYDVGDLWVQGSDGDIVRCKTAKISGQSYADADWVKCSKYTNDDKANEAMTKANANAEAIETNHSELTLTKNSLTALVERTTAVEDRVTTAEASLLLKADSAALKVVRETADAAQSAADAAQSTADTAKTDAANAQTAADAAQSSADSAQSTADSNASSITALTSRVESAEQKITADAIVSTVTSSTSYKALSSTASTAKSTAETAQSTANTAKSNAANAQSTANTAKSTADTAKSKADGNATDITGLKTRMTTAESKIDQKADSITLSVLEKKVNGISVGGRNLLRNTNQGTANWNWSMQTGGRTIEEYLDGGVRAVKMTRDATPYAGWSYISYAIGKDAYALLEPDTEYIVSMDYKPTVAAPNGIYVNICTVSAADHAIETATYDQAIPADEWTHIAVPIKTKPALPAFNDHLVYFTGFSSAVNSVHIFKNLKLEKGNKATDWSPAPEDPAGSLSVSSDYSKVDINKDRVRIVSKQMEVAVPSDDGEDDVLRVDADGVHAEVVEADRIVSESVVHTQGAASYTPANAGELAEILTELSGKHLTGDVDINCLHVTSGNFEVQGLYGAAGNLTLRNGAMNALTVRGCDRSAVVYVESMAFSTSGVAVAVDNAAVMLTECSLSAGTGLRLGANWPSEAWMTDCEGDCTTLATLGSYSRLYVGGIKPAGTLNCAAGSEVYNSTDDPTFTAASSPSIPTTQTVTVSLSPTSTSTSGYGSKLYQGRYSSSQSLRKGVMLFSLPSDLTSADKIDSATLTIKRIGGVGQGGGVSVHVRCYDVPGTLYASKTAYENQSVSIDVTSAVKAMKTNGYGGLMLYNPDTTTVGSKSYTASYSRFAGNGESGAPVLKISYRK